MDKKGIFHLLRGKDKTKDQSYFLYRLNQEQLSRVIFPLGEMTKEETKKMARKNNLPVNADSESQEICFLGDTDYREFLRKNLPKKYFRPGNIVNTKGKIIGRHEGFINYTIGQRKGINQTEMSYEVGLRKNMKDKKRLYVIRFDKKKNELIVGADRDLLKKEVIVNDLSWVSSWAKEKALKNKNILAKIRYRHIAVPCSVQLFGQKLKVIFKTSQRAIVPGQSLVIYSGEEVLGGGVIV
jgi:tRNA-specific 2-thiouridylase